MGEDHVEVDPHSYFARMARDARRRAEAAAERAQALHLAAHRRTDTDDDVPMSSDLDLDRARLRAHEAFWRLITALRRSADTHDRTADALEKNPSPSPDTRQRALLHRAAAAADREKADRLEVDGPARPPTMITP
ncbi:MAG: hypothetical protein HOU01_23745 [Streptomycetaceae bacterium]|nr:hypothetical protein [Streptomycetaceae bacterium]